MHRMPQRKRSVPSRNFASARIRLFQIADWGRSRPALSSTLATASDVNLAGLQKMIHCGNLRSLTRDSGGLHRSFCFV
jgi:hypothetical protein